MTTPWIRKIEVTVSGVPDWTAPQGAGMDVTFFADGSNDNLRIRFRISKHGSGYATPSVIEIYNLGPETRSALLVTSGNVTVNVGWDNTDMSLLFSGPLQSAYSRREGSDIITTLCCVSEMGITNRIIAESGGEWYMGPGMYLGTDDPSNPGDGGVILNVASVFDGITVDPKDINVPGRVIGARGYTFSGSVRECLNELSRVYGFDWAVIDGRFQAVATGYGLQGEAVDISSEDGFLLRIEPILDNIFQHQLAAVSIQSLLLPLIKPARVVNVTAASNPSLSGAYYVHALTHSGDSHSNLWETICQTDLVNRSPGGAFI